MWEISKIESTEKERNSEQKETEEKAWKRREMLEVAPSLQSASVSLDYHQYDSPPYPSKEIDILAAEVNAAVSAQNLKSQTQTLNPLINSVASSETKMEVENIVVEVMGSIEKKKKQRNSIVKGVRFDEKTTKSWDGLDKFNSDFDDLLFCFLVKGQSVGDGDILQWCGEDCQRIFSMCFLLNDLIVRLQKVAAEVQVPCLPGGGGRAIRVEKVFEPYLLSLLSVLATALSICVQSPRNVNYDRISATDLQKKMIDHFMRNKGDTKVILFKLDSCSLKETDSAIVSNARDMCDTQSYVEIVTVNNMEVEHVNDTTTAIQLDLL